MKLPPKEYRGVLDNPHVPVRRVRIGARRRRRSTSAGKARPLHELDELKRAANADRSGALHHSARPDQVLRHGDLDRP